MDETEKFLMEMKIKHPDWKFRNNGGLFRDVRKPMIHNEYIRTFPDGSTKRIVLTQAL